jgi:hypothetical protein
MPPRPPHAYGPIVLSAIILIAFAAVVLFVVTTAIPTANSQIANILVGTLATLACQVCTYWMGASASGARKDLQLADAQAALATSVPTSALPSLAPPAS